MSNSDTRIDWIDTIKGIGIILMIMGHVGFGGLFDRWIHSFHMPMFFIISGFLYKPTNRPIKQVFLRKLHSLLVPYFVFLIINYLVWLVLEYSDGSIIDPIIAALTYNTHGLPIGGAIWFLTALFFAEILFYIFNLNIRNIICLNFLVFCIAIGSSLFTTVCDIRLPFSLDQSLVGLGFLQIGYLFSRLIRSKNVIISNIGKSTFQRLLLIILVLVSSNVILSFINGYVNMKEGWYSNVFLFWINSVLGTVLCLFVGFFISKFSSIVCSIINTIGRNSIIFLGLNQLFILCFEIMGIPYIGNSGNITGIRFLGSTAITIGTITILFFLSKLLLESNLKILFGRSR